MLNALNVSGVERDDSSMDHSASRPGYMDYLATDQVNDEVIEDIQKRLELLDEFK